MEGREKECCWLAGTYLTYQCCGMVAIGSEKSGKVEEKPW